MWEKVNATTTLCTLEHKNALPKTATVNGDLVFQLYSWVQEMRKRGHKMMLMSAPYEADAQLVALQNQGLIDMILSQDGDIVMHRPIACSSVRHMYMIGNSACSALYPNPVNIVYTIIPKQKKSHPPYA